MTGPCTRWRQLTHPGVSAPVGLALALTACSTASAPCVEPLDAAFALALGTGSPADPRAYRLLSDGDTVAMVAGNQGGQHIWIQLHAQSVCVVQLRVRIRVIRASDELVLGFSQFAANAWTEVPDAPGTYTSTPYAALIDPDRYCSVLNGGNVRVEVVVDDPAGHSAAGSVNLVIHGWSPDVPPTERAARDACCADYANTRCWPSGGPDAG